MQSNPIQCDQIKKETQSMDWDESGKGWKRRSEARRRKEEEEEEMRRRRRDGNMKAIISSRSRRSRSKMICNLNHLIIHGAYRATPSSPIFPYR